MSEGEKDIVKNFLSNLVKGSTPGAKKLEFPYEVPPLAISITPEAKQTLYVTAGILGLGWAMGGILNYVSNNK